jgi:hypothetical protein
VYNKDTVGYNYEQKWFNLFVDIQALQDGPTQDKDILNVSVNVRIPHQPSITLNNIRGSGIEKLGHAYNRLWRPKWM